MTAPDVNADVRARFEVELAKLPTGAQANIRDAMSRGESLSFNMFAAGYRAAHADLSGEVRELKLVIEGLSQYSHNAQEVRELVDAAIPALAELRNYRDDCEDYEAPENVPELEATIAKLAAALAKHTHQEMMGEKMTLRESVLSIPAREALLGGQRYKYVRLEEVLGALDAHLTKPAQAVDGWQPIETAPKDGTWILAYDESLYTGRIASVRWDGEEFRTDDMPCYEPTHWMPLPSPPAALPKDSNGAEG